MGVVFVFGRPKPDEYAFTGVIPLKGSIVALVMAEEEEGVPKGSVNDVRLVAVVVVGGGTVDIEAKEFDKALLLFV